MECYHQWRATTVGAGKSILLCGQNVLILTPLSLPHHNILPMQHHKNHTERKGCDAVELSKCYWVGDELSAELRQQRDGRENGDTDQVRFLLLP
jgi:hypothetical protein